MSTGHFDRRSFLKFAAGAIAYHTTGGLAFGSHQPQHFNQSLAAAISKQLPPLDGVLVFDPQVCNQMASDFGHFVHQLPIGVLYPGSIQDIQKMVVFARDQRLKIAMHGHACSAYGQAQVSGGIVINTQSFKGISWCGDDSLDVEPGATWSDVTVVALTRGLTPPVVPDTLFLTVGGTLSSGGLGETSHRFGSQTDHVLELEVVTGTGERQVCSHSQNAQLFNAVLAGMGQCAFIVRARIKLVKAPASVTVQEFVSADAAKFIGDLAAFARLEEQNAIAGHAVRSSTGAWTFGTTYTTWDRVGGPTSTGPKHMTFEDYLNRNTNSYNEAIRTGSFYLPHPYLSFFTSEAAAVSVLETFTRDPHASLGASTVAVFPLVTRHFRRPLFRLPAGELVYHIRIYRKAKIESSPEHLEMLRLNQEVFVPWILDTGGTLYLPHAPVLTSARWRQHFGAQAWAFLEASKRIYDPDLVLTPGAGMF